MMSLFYSFFMNMQYYVALVQLEKKKRPLAVAEIHGSRSFASSTFSSLFLSPPHSLRYRDTLNATMCVSRRRTHEDARVIFFFFSFFFF